MEATPDVEEDELEETLEVAKFDLFKIGVGVILHLADIVFDVYAAIEIYYHSSSEFFAAAIIFIIVPAVITNLISWLCYHDDNNSSVSTGIIHMLLLGQIKRVIDLFRFAVKLLQGKIQSTKNAMIKFNSWYADVAMIGMIEALLESDPQAILQLSRIIPGNPDDNFNFGVKRTLSAIFSFISVGFAIASYHVTIRKPQSQKKKICKKGYLIHWIWHLMITGGEKQKSTQRLGFSLFFNTLRSLGYLHPPPPSQQLTLVYISRDHHKTHQWREEGGKVERRTTVEHTGLLLGIAAEHRRGTVECTEILPCIAKPEV